MVIVRHEGHVAAGVKAGDGEVEPVGDDSAVPGGKHEVVGGRRGKPHGIAGEERLAATPLLVAPQIHAQFTVGPRWLGPGEAKCESGREIGREDAGGAIGQTTPLTNIHPREGSVFGRRE